MSRALLASLLAASCFSAPAFAYEVATLDGRILPAESIEFAGPACVVTGNGRVHRLASTEVDYYETFRRNANSGEGNVVVFRTGAFFRFETLSLERSRVVLGLGDQGKVSVPEQAVDFEQSVREAATIRLPRGDGRVDVARSPGLSGTARGSSAFGGSPGSSAPPRGRAVSPGTRRGSARLEGPGSSGRRGAALRGRDSEGSSRSEYEPNEPPASRSFRDESGADAPREDEPAQEERASRRDGMSDADELRRRAEEEGEATGNVSIIVSSNDAVDVAGVQFRLRYPTTCSPVGAAPIGAFANASMAQPNGSVGGRPEFAMAIVFAADATTSLPGEIARIDFTWRGSPPSEAEFLVTSATATGRMGSPIRGFRAEAVLLQ